MELSEFRSELLESVNLEAESNNDGTVPSFVGLMANELIEQNIVMGFEPLFFQGTGKRRQNLRIDGYFIEPLDEQLTLYIADYDGGQELVGLSYTDAVATLKKAKNLFLESLDSELASRIDHAWPIGELLPLINENREIIRRVRIIMLTDKQMSSRINKIDYETFEQYIIEYQIWDIEKFCQMSLIGKEVEAIEIDFQDYIDKGIPCLAASTIDEKNISSYLCVIDGNTLADIYDKYGSRLLEGNVRSFLSLTVKVNKKIRETILKEPDMFFSYNNGISATASSIEFADSEKKIIRSVNNLQIVNGGQTTATISTARFKDKADLSKIYVQMKLTTIDSKDSDEIIPIISRSSNSQNKISEADFFSTHSFHIRMEQHSNRIFTPPINGLQYGTHWFYERARGQYTQKQLKMSKTEKEKYQKANPKVQLMTKTDVSKYVNSWEQKPEQVSKGAQANFVDFADAISKKWDKDETVFNEEYFRNMVSLAILFKNTEKLVSKQEWYQNSYRANIVTYTIAAFAFLIQERFKGYSLNFSKIWAEQTLSPELHYELGILAKLVQDHITDKGRPVVNVTQWCKQKLCWEKLKTVISTHIFSNDIFRCLIENTESREIMKESKKTQKLDDEFELIKYVSGKSGSYWSELAKWGIEKKLLSEIDMITLTPAIKISSGKLPDKKQCVKLINLEKRLSENGFKTTTS